jgi:parallel beta-helix repeat protein
MLFIFDSEENQMKPSSILSKFFIITMMLMLLVMVPLSSVSAATPIFVQPGGDDALCNGTVPVDYSAGVAPACAVQTIQQGIALVDMGGTVNVGAGTYVLAGSISANKVNITINGESALSTFIQTDVSDGYAFNVSADGVTIQNFNLEKTDKAGTQNLIYVGSDNVTVQNMVIHGQYVFGDGDVSRAFEAAYGSANLTIAGNTIYSLRQPGYLNGSLAAPTTGPISNNTVYGTRGWVLAGAAMTFTGNTFTSGSTGNIFDIVIIAGTDASYYPDIVAVSEANHDAVVEDQRVSPAVLSVVHVNDDAAAGGNGGYVQPYQTVAPAIVRVVAGGKILVHAGEYLEDNFTINKAGVSLLGDGYATTTLKGNKASGGAHTLIFSANNITVSGFTITRDGNNVTDWTTNVKNQGVIFNNGTTGNILQNCQVTGNRNGVYLNNTQNNIIQNNIITFNRTGIQFANNVTGTVVEENEITDNWTMGILFNFDSATLQTTGVTINNNNITGNWYGEVQTRWLNSPAILNLSNNWFGGTTITKDTINSTEPGYAAQIPVEYGGTSTNPGGGTMLGGVSSALVDYTPWLLSATDTNLGEMGFQGDLTELNVDDDSPQSGTVGRIQEGIDSVSGSTVYVAAGSYYENIRIDVAGLELIGEDKATTFVYPAVSLPNPCAGSSLCGSPTAASNIMLVEANDVIIHGFTLDGDNPSLTSGIVRMGADLDARNGVIDNYYAGVFDNLEVYDTIVKNIYLRGVYSASYGAGTHFHDLAVDNVMGDTNSIAVMIYGGSGIIENNVVSNANDGIVGQYSTGTQFLNNTVSDSGTGIHTDNNGGMGGVADVISGNTVTNNVYGLFVFAPYLPVSVTGNTVTNCDVGMALSGQGAVTNPTFTNNVLVGDNGVGTAGIYITTTLWGWGTADVSGIFMNNQVTNFETALYLETDADMNLSATLNDNSFTGYVYGASTTGAGTFAPDVSGNWWETAVPAEVNTAANNGLLVDYTPWLAAGTDISPDMGFQGDFTSLYVDDNSPQVGSVTRIQEGVDMVEPGGTVNVVAGAYPEQVIITKDLSLVGEDQATTTIQAFASMPTCFTTSKVHKPIVCVMDGAVSTISNFTIDGAGLGNSNVNFEGVAFRNAGGTLSDNTIVDIRDTPFSGAQHGVAVYAYNTDPTEYTINVVDNTISGFQKNAMALNAGDTTPMITNVSGNLITGAGSTGVTAQNGIQVWTPSGHGLVAGNTIDGIAYTGTGWVATSILNYYTDLDITNNLITNAHMGVYNIEGGGAINGNTLTVVDSNEYAYGINASDPPEVKPQPYMEDETSALAASQAPMAPSATLAVEVANNTVTFVGVDKTASVGIEADAGYETYDMTVDVHHNRVTGFDNGLVFWQCTASTYCTSTVFTSISANYNDLFDNNLGIYLSPAVTVVPEIHHNRIFGVGATGLYNDSALALTAENNWWGCNEGPTTDGSTDCNLLFGTVDADPWLILESSIAATANDLFFSEYLEGSSNNKALEIYNGTGLSVDLSAYELAIYWNGSPTASATRVLSGILADGDVFVITPTDAAAEIRAVADLIVAYPSPVHFNGDDAVAIRRVSDGSLVDVIGQIGFDPGSVWGTNPITTAEHTLVRMDTVRAGDTDGSNAYDPAGEWISFPQNTFTYIGSYAPNWSEDIDVTGSVSAISRLITNSDASDTSPIGFVYDGILMAYSAMNGTMTPPTDGTDSGYTSSVYTPTYAGVNDVCVDLDNEQLCNPVNVSSSTDITALQLLGSLDQSTWTTVYGDIDGGYTLPLDPALEYQYLDAGTYTVTRTLADGYYGFYLDETAVPTDFFTYWAAKGVVSGATGWQGVMWEIINGNLPMFFLKVDGADYTLLDGMQYIMSGGTSESPLRISGDYPLGGYSFSGTVTDIYGGTGTENVAITFVALPDITALQLLGSTDASTWTPVDGDINGGYTYGLDPALAYQFLDAGTTTVNNTLVDGNYGFYLDETTVPAGFFAYWDAKGVNASAAVGTWQEWMWQIINGNQPMFYLKVAGAEYTLLDGLSLDFFSNETFLRVSGDYPLGSYSFFGTVTDIYGGTGAETVMITFEAAFVATTTAVDCGSGSPVVTYGDPITCIVTVTAESGTITPTGTVAWTTDISGTFVTSPCTLSGTGGVATCSVDYTPDLVGTGLHLLTATYSGDTAFTGSFGDQTLTVGKRAITITADAISKIVGETDPALTYAITAGTLAFSDAVSGTLSRDPGEAIGTYAITIGSLAVNENYEVTFVSNWLTILARHFYFTQIHMP